MNRGNLLELAIDPTSVRDMDVFDVPYEARREVPWIDFMRLATDHALRFRKIKGGANLSFWDVQGIVSRLRGSRPRGRPPRPLDVLLVRASLPGARIRGTEPPPMIG